MKQTTIIATAISATLISLVILQHNLSFKGTIVLPAGGTYLGPTTTPPPTPAPAPATGSLHKGRIYPYSFETPETLKLVTFNDTFDIYAISKEGMDPYNAVLIGVDDITKKNKPLIDYINEWWKQFGGLKGVDSITEFTNSKGLKGYSVKYVNGSSDDVFFEVPDPGYVIHLANGPLDKKIFDAIVDSVTWEKK